jgi:hypothetical protein
MAMTLWTTFGLVVWLVLWALGAKTMDATLLLGLILIIGATQHILTKYLPGRG